jgi:hypothetical protein
MKNIHSIEKFFKGEKILLTKELMSLMEKASKKIDTRKR